MAPRPTRSLRHEYELFVEQEIENYKESVPRNVLLGIGDDAVAAMLKQQQLALTELLVWEEVDRIIFKRLRLPSYATWRRRRVKLIEELRRPEHWGLRPDHALVRALPNTDGHVLVAGADDDVASLYLAANGCDVTISGEAEIVERVMQAAIEAGLGQRVHAQIGDLATFSPRSPLSAVVVSPAALEGLSAEERARVIESLQSATMDGGIHLVHMLATSSKSGAGTSLSLDELRSRYRGWSVSVERAESGGTGGGSGVGASSKSKTFLARQGAA
jgi:hypothetical protein